MQLQRLLVIIDPEHAQQPALQRAAWLARKTGAQLHLLLLDYHPNLEGGLLDGSLLARARSALLEQRREALEASMAPLRESGLHVALDVRWGKRRHETILECITALQPDILLKSIHPGNALHRLLLSDSSWQLIRRCPIPLWLVHDGPWQGQTLCTALDPMHSADKPATLDHRLIHESLDLQAQLGLQAHYLHAMAPMPHSLLFDTEVAQQYDDYVTQSLLEHRQAFHALIDQYAAIAADRAHLLEGFAEEVIPSFVHKHNIDLLLMGAIARGQLDTLLIGHTAERVLERVACDLLVIKPNGKG